jgi:epoxyqueuosine reductase
MKREFLTRLKNYALEQGAVLFGTASVKEIKDEFKLLEEESRGLDYAISFGFKLSDAVLDGIREHPTKLYFHHYRMVNMFLDQLSLKMAGVIEREGFKALAIPASQIVDWKEQSSHLSHKRVAYLAGLGWIGRNNLLVNPRFGSRLRFATILTDVELPFKEPMAFGCGDCELCMSVCPAGAIKRDPKDFDHMACYNKLDQFKKRNLVGQHICGICVKVCREKE